MEVNRDQSLSYLIGAFLGDGCNYRKKHNYQISITSEDDDFCEKVKVIIEEVFNKSGSIKKVKRKDGTYSYSQLVVCSKEISDYFQDITGNRDKIPDFIYNDKNMIKLFTRGLMDADGWISKVNASDGYTRFRTGFKNIKDWVSEFRDIFDILNIRAGQVRKRENYRYAVRTKDTFQFTINSEDFCNNVGFSIDRKVKLQNEYLNWVKVPHIRQKTQ